MKGKLILIPRFSLIDALDIMERQNKIGEKSNDRIIVAAGRDYTYSESKDYQFVVATMTDEIFREVINDFKDRIPDLYIQDQQTKSK